MTLKDIATNKRVRFKILRKPCAGLFGLYKQTEEKKMYNFLRSFAHSGGV
jgi:hypothetical protein